MKESIEEEAKQWDVDNEATKDSSPPLKSGDADAPVTEEGNAGTVDTVGATTNGEQPSSPETTEDTNINGTATSMASGEKERPAETSEAVKDHGDNGEEVVEGEEDTVIY